MYNNVTSTFTHISIIVHLGFSVNFRQSYKLYTFTYHQDTNRELIDIIRNNILNDSTYLSLHTCDNMYQFRMCLNCFNILPNYHATDIKTANNMDALLYNANMLYTNIQPRTTAAFDEGVSPIKSINTNIFEKYFNVPYSKYNNSTLNLIGLYLAANKEHFGKTTLTTHQTNLSIKGIQYLYENVWSLNLNKLTTAELLNMNLTLRGIEDD